MDIVKEVESALEEEGYVKIDSTSPSTMSTVSSPVSVSSNKTSSLTGVTSVHSQSVRQITSPAQQIIRPDVSSSDLSENVASSKGSANVSSSSDSSTWQRQNSGQDHREDEQSSGVWGWMSNAVSAGLQTTQNIGRNIVEKTKVLSIKLTLYLFLFFSNIKFFK